MLANVLKNAAHFFYFHSALRAFACDINLKKNMRQRSNIVRNKLNPIGKANGIY